MPEDADQLERLNVALSTRYRVDRALGHGGMATVFLAEDLKHNRPVALKVLSPELAAALGADRFLEEISVAAHLQHPHILGLIDSGVADALLYYVMPFIEGGALRDRLTREKQLRVEDSIRITREVADALAYAHAHGIIHRDVKPENILLEAEHAIVADFGIARAVSAAGGTRLTETGIAVGTPAYMSPEQAAGDRDIDGRSDVYSLGCVLYEMLSGEPPYTGPTPQAILAKKLSEPLPRISVVREAVSPGIEAVLSKVLARTPADRFTTAAQFAEALAEAVAGTRGPVVRARQDPAVLIARRAHRRRIGAALGGVGVLIAALLGWLKFRQVQTVPVVLNHLAVLPFAVHGGKNLDFLSQGLVDLLSRDLDGTVDIRTVNGATVLATAHATGGGVADLEEGRHLARRLGASLYVVGSVSGIGNELRIDAGLYDGRPAQPTLVSQTGVSGDSSQLFDLVDRLAGDLMVQQRHGPGSRLLETAAITTRSLPALKAYLDAERHLRLTERDSALAGFRRAVQLDSTFALAYYRLAVAADLYARSEDVSLIRPNIKRAIALGGRLSTRDQRLLTSFAALIAGKLDEAERGYRDLLRDYPDDLDAQWQLANLLFWPAAIRGRSPFESRPVWAGIIKLDPEFLCPI